MIVKTGNAPRPGTWALEKSIDGGKTFTPWQYFATTNSECIKYFGFSSLLQSFKDDTTVTCTTAYSQVPPFEDGEVSIDKYYLEGFIVGSVSHQQHDGHGFNSS